MALKCRYVLAQRRLRHAKPACCISVMQLLGEYDEFAIISITVVALPPMSACKTIACRRDRLQAESSYLSTMKSSTDSIMESKVHQLESFCQIPISLPRICTGCRRIGSLR